MIFGRRDFHEQCRSSIPPCGRGKAGQALPPMTSVWHCYADAGDMRPGTSVLITGGGEAVELVEQSLLSIDLPDGQRVDATILEESAEHLVIAILDQAPILLRRSEADAVFENFKLSDGFSRQVWIVA